MNRTFLLLLVFLACGWTLTAQDARLVSIRNVKPVTRAVVVGISDYQDPAISDLQFADRDAMAFADWLLDEAGAGLSPEQVLLLTNENATTGNVMAGFTWLINDSRPGDQAVICFSGHGDVEKVSAFQRGYLLSYNTPATVYMSGGFEVRIIQDIITTLSQNNVQVIMISDACRAGKLAGSETGGTQATASALASKFANEVKILSCQPDEFSVEGEQWGGGRGAFSYHLVDGLYGLADQDEDLEVNLFELQRYVQDMVSREVSPQSQLPMAVGNPKTRLAGVRPDWVEALKAQKASQTPALKSIDMRSLETMVLTTADTSIQELYTAFEESLQRGDLLAPKGASADDYYRRLMVEPETARLHGLMTRNFAAALVDEAQEILNKLLKTDPMVVSDIWSRPFAFDHIPGYLARAAEILGEGHFYYNQLKAKQLFFEGKTILPEQYPGLSPDSVARLAVRKYEQALEYDPQAAYVHVELGFLCYYKLLQLDRARIHADKALELSPNWPYALWLAGTCRRHEPGDDATNFLLKALELDSSFLMPYQELYLHYLVIGPYERYVYYLDKFILQMEDRIAANPQDIHALYWMLYGGSLYWAGQYEQAEKVLLKADSLTKGTDLGCNDYLCCVYTTLGECEKARSYCERSFVLAPNLPTNLFNLFNCFKETNAQLKMVNILEPYLNKMENPPINLAALWGDVLQEAGRNDEARAVFRKILERLPDFSNDFEMNMIGRAYLGLGDLAAMERTIEAGLRRFPDNIYAYIQAACLYSLAREEQKALEWLEKAIEKGFWYSPVLRQDPDLFNIRHTEGFKALMEKYFPEIKEE